MGRCDGEALARKRLLLEAEGVRFDARGRVDPGCLWVFEEGVWP